MIRYISNIFSFQDSKIGNDTWMITNCLIESRDMQRGCLRSLHAWIHSEKRILNIPRKT